MTLVSTSRQYPVQRIWHHIYNPPLESAILDVANDPHEDSERLSVWATILPVGGRWGGHFLTLKSSQRRDDAIPALSSGPYALKRLIGKRRGWSRERMEQGQGICIS